MKKILSIVFALCLVLTISVFAVSAEDTNVAKVGETEYASLQAAIDAAATSGKPVQLIANVVLDTAVSDDKPSKSAHGIAVWGGQTVELDLAGHTITGTAGNAGGKNYFVIKVFSGSLTIDDTVGGGAIICDTANPGSVRTTVISNYSGTVVLNGGTIENKVSGVSGAYGIESATTHGDSYLTINDDAKVYTPYSQAVNVTANDKNFVSNFEMNGGELSGKYALQLFYPYGGAGCVNNWAINGGIISGTSEALCVASSNNADWKDTNLTITGGTFEGIVYTYGDKAEEYMTSTKPITGGTYSTLDACKYLGENAEVTIVLDGEVTLSEALVITDNVTIKGSENGATITTSAEDVFTVTGTLTLGENLTVNSTSSILYANGGEIIVDGAELNSANSPYGLAYVGSGKLTVKDGSVLNQTGATYTTVSVSGANSSAEILGGDIYSELGSAIVSKKGASVTISGGSVQSATTNYFAAYATGSGSTLTIKGEAAIISGGDAAVAAAGGSTVVIEDGIITGGVYASDNAESNVTISGGSVSGSVVSRAGGPIVITGGTFAADVTEFLTGNYTQNEDGSVTIPTYGVTIDTLGGGSAITAQQAYAEGETVEVVVGHANGYSLEKVEVVDIYGDPVEVEGTTFVMPACPVEVTVTFKKVFPKAAEIVLTAKGAAEGNYKYQLSYLYNDSEIVVETVVNPENGEIEFAPLKAYAPATYTFFIKQIAVDEAGAETVVTTVQINAKVSYGKDGYLAATLSQAEVVFAK